MWYLKYSGVPYKRHSSDPGVGLDCVTASRLALKELGFDVPDKAIPCIEEDFAEFDIESGDRYWEYLGDKPTDASVAGDVICNEPLPGYHHVSVMVNPSEYRILTAIEGRGAVVTHIRFLKNITGVYRFKG
jgi:hypothetical protein